MNSFKNAKVFAELKDKKPLFQKKELNSCNTIENFGQRSDEKLNDMPKQMEEQPKSGGKPTLDNLNTIDGLTDYFADGGHIKLMP